MIAFYHLCSSFKIVKWLFKFFADGQIFDFPKLFQYGILSQSSRGFLYVDFYILPGQKGLGFLPSRSSLMA